MICGRKFVGKGSKTTVRAIWENSGKNPSHHQTFACSQTYGLFIQHIKTAGRGWLRWEYKRGGKAALTSVIDVIKESDWFIIVYCFLTVGSIKFF